MTSLRLAAALPAIALVALAVAPGCKDQGKLSATRAREHVTGLKTLADNDVEEVERGLPVGAARLAALYEKGDPKQDLPAVRSALAKIRREVPDLNVAKSTFFALADEKGVAIRNDLEQDAMAGQNLSTVFPELSKAIAGQYVATTGAFPGAVSKAGPDKDWIAAVPVKKGNGSGDGAVLGILVSGWTYRYFARHLQETLRRELQDELQKAGSTKMPIVYVAVFDKSGVYSAPTTPAINDKALADLDLVSKTASGIVDGQMTVADRDFGYAAARIQKMGPDVGIAVLRSEI